MAGASNKHSCTGVPEAWGRGTNNQPTNTDLQERQDADDKGWDGASFAQRKLHACAHSKMTVWAHSDRIGNMITTRLTQKAHKQTHKQKNSQMNQYRDKHTNNLCS